MQSTQRGVYTCENCKCQNSFKITDLTDECYNCGNVINLKTKERIYQSAPNTNIPNYLNYNCSLCGGRNTYLITDIITTCNHCRTTFDIVRGAFLIKEKVTKTYTQPPINPNQHQKSYRSKPPGLSSDSRMNFIGWLVFWLVGSAIIGFICAFIENFDLLNNWSGFMRGVLIIGILGWGAFLAWRINND